MSLTLPSVCVFFRYELCASLVTSTVRAVFLNPAPLSQASVSLCSWIPYLIPNAEYSMILTGQAGNRFHANVRNSEVHGEPVQDPVFAAHVNPFPVRRGRPNPSITFYQPRTQQGLEGARSSEAHAQARDCDSNDPHGPDAQMDVPSIPGGTSGGRAAPPRTGRRATAHGML